MVSSGCLVPPCYFFKGSGALSGMDSLLVRAHACCAPDCFGGWRCAMASFAAGAVQ